MGKYLLVLTHLKNRGKFPRAFLENLTILNVLNSMLVHERIHAKECGYFRLPHLESYKESIRVPKIWMKYTWKYVVSKFYFSMCYVVWFSIVINNFLHSTKGYLLGIFHRIMGTEDGREDGGLTLFLNAAILVMITYFPLWPVSRSSKYIYVRAKIPSCSSYCCL